MKWWSQFSCSWCLLSFRVNLGGFVLKGWSGRIPIHRGKQTPRWFDSRLISSHLDMVVYRICFFVSTSKGGFSLFCILLSIFFSLVCVHILSSLWLLVWLYSLYFLWAICYYHSYLLGFKGILCKIIPGSLSLLP